MRDSFVTLLAVSGPTLAGKVICANQAVCTVCLGHGILFFDKNINLKPTRPKIVFYGDTYVTI